MLVAMLANRNTNSQNKQVGNNTNQSGKTALMSSLHSRNQFQFQQNINVNTYFQINITMDMLTFNVGGQVVVQVGDHLPFHSIAFEQLKCVSNQSNSFVANKAARACAYLFNKKKTTNETKTNFLHPSLNQVLSFMGKLKMHNVGK